MTNETKSTAPANEPILILERVFDAPRDLVWKAWTDPVEYAKWFFPVGYNATKVELDVRPGGANYVEMTGPDGSVYPMKGKYIEVDPPNRMSYTDVVDEDEKAWGDTPPPSQIQTISFEDLGGKTKVTVHLQVASIEDRDALVTMGAVFGWASSFEKLDALLAA